MQYLDRLSLLAVLAFTLITPRAAYSVVAVNAASFANPAMPNGGIAQESLFVAFGAAPA